MLSRALLPIHPPIPTTPRPSLSPSLFPSLSLCPFVPSSFHPSLRPSVPPSLHPSLRPSVPLSVPPSLPPPPPLPVPQNTNLAPRCRGGPCPSLSPCGSLHPTFSACWFHDLDDAAPLEAPPVTDFTRLPDARGGQGEEGQGGDRQQNLTEVQQEGTNSSTVEAMEIFFRQYTLKPFSFQVGVTGGLGFRVVRKQEHASLASSSHLKRLSD